MEHDITFHKIIQLFEEYQQKNPQLNSFGFGNLVDFGKSFSGTSQTPQYPYMFVVPQSIQYDENTTQYSLTILFTDILNTDVRNEMECVSDMSLAARRFISYVKRGMEQDPPLYNYMDIVMSVQALPFMERFSDHVAGVALSAQIVVFEDINACDFYPSPTPTPSNTPTNTPTPSTTPTPTPTPVNHWLLYEDGQVMESEQGDLIEYQY